MNLDTAEIYDMIIASDIMSGLVIDILYNKGCFEWEWNKTPIKMVEKLSNPITSEIVYNMCIDNPILK